LSDTVTAILDSAGRFPVLRHDRQLELSYRVRAWLDWDPANGPCPVSIEAKGRKAKARLLETNLRLVVSQAKRYRHIRDQHPDAYADLIQEGVLGLNRAIEKYDPTRGYCLSTYAISWIRQSIGRSVPYITDIIRRPAHIHDHRRKLTKLIASYEREHDGQRPSREWLAQQTGLTHRQIEAAVVIGHVKLCSLDQLARDDSGADGSTLIDLIPDQRTISPEDQLHQDNRVELANDILEQLSDDDALLLKSIYFDDATYKDCSPLFNNISRSGIGLKKAAALERARTIAAGLTTVDHSDLPLRDPVTCVQCGEDFIPTLRNRQRLCSDACRTQRHRNHTAATKARAKAKRLAAVA